MAYGVFAQVWLQKHRVMGRPVHIEPKQNGAMLVLADLHWHDIPHLLQPNFPNFPAIYYRLTGQKYPS